MRFSHSRLRKDRDHVDSLLNVSDNALDPVTADDPCPPGWAGDIQSCQGKMAVVRFADEGVTEMLLPSFVNRVMFRENKVLEAHYVHAKDIPSASCRAVAGIGMDTGSRTDVLVQRARGLHASRR
ncbi:protein of unknown function [Methylocaldum szegediense]|uniref:Uncharacterized protein n=1 Tax=Methylocaldum szegediense TaxID=73780 RepID=A0ABN8X650_9GAMM|nr:protein of unknown function [Methylocaldum szegediense]